MTLIEIADRFPTEDACKAELARRRWPDGKVVCPRCRLHLKVYKSSQPWRWICKNHKTVYRFSVTAGTIFADTKIPLRKWFQAIAMLVDAKKSISAKQMQRHLGLKSYESAWYMCHRIRAAMQNHTFERLTGHVEIDETFVGGKNRNRHGGGAGYMQRTGRRRPETTDDKAKVIGAISRKGNVVCRVIEHIDERTVGAFVAETIADRVSVSTDQASAYKHLDWQSKDIRHESVNHNKGEYVRGAVHTANIDSFWSILKRGIMGSFHQVSRDYLPLYVNEFAFRHNFRDHPDLFGRVLESC